MTSDRIHCDDIRDANSKTDSFPGFKSNESSSSMNLRYCNAEEGFHRIINTSNISNVHTRKGSYKNKILDSKSSNLRNFDLYKYKHIKKAYKYSYNEDNFNEYNSDRSNYATDISKSRNAPSEIDNDAPIDLKVSRVTDNNKNDDLNDSSDCSEAEYKSAEDDIYSSPLNLVKEQDSDNVNEINDDIIAQTDNKISSRYNDIVNEAGTFRNDSKMISKRSQSDYGLDHRKNRLLDVSSKYAIDLSKSNSSIEEFNKNVANESSISYNNLTQYFPNFERKKKSMKKKICNYKNVENEFLRENVHQEKMYCDDRSGNSKDQNYLFPHSKVSETNKSFEGDNNKTIANNQFIANKHEEVNDKITEKSQKVESVQVLGNRDSDELIDEIKNQTPINSTDDIKQLVQVNNRDAINETDEFVETNIENKDIMYSKTTDEVNRERIDQKSIVDGEFKDRSTNADTLIANSDESEDQINTGEATHIDNDEFGDQNDEQDEGLKVEKDDINIDESSVENYVIKNQNVEGLVTDRQINEISTVMEENDEVTDQNIEITDHNMKNDQIESKKLENDVIGDANVVNDKIKDQNLDNGKIKDQIIKNDEINDRHIHIDEIKDQNISIDEIKDQHFENDENKDQNLDDGEINDQIIKIDEIKDKCISIDGIKDQHFENDENKDLNLDNGEIKDQIMKIDEIKDKSISINEINDQNIHIDENKDQPLENYEIKNQNINIDEIKDQNIPIGESKDQNISIDEIKDQHFENDEIKYQHFENDEIKDQNVENDGIKEQNLEERPLSSGGLKDQVKIDENKDKNITIDEINDKNIHIDETKDQHLKNDEIENQNMNIDEIKDTKISIDEIKDQNVNIDENVENGEIKNENIKSEELFNENDKIKDENCKIQNENIEFDKNEVEVIKDENDEIKENSDKDKDFKFDNKNEGLIDEIENQNGHVSVKVNDIDRPKNDDDGKDLNYNHDGVNNQNDEDNLKTDQNSIIKCLDEVSQKENQFKDDNCMIENNRKGMDKSSKDGDIDEKIEDGMNKINDSENIDSTAKSNENKIEETGESTNEGGVSAESNNNKFGIIDDGKDEGSSGGNISVQNDEFKVNSEEQLLEINCDGNVEDKGNTENETCKLQRNDIDDKGLDSSDDIIEINQLNNNMTESSKSVKRTLQNKSGCFINKKAKTSETFIQSSTDSSSESPSTNSESSSYDSSSESGSSTDSSTDEDNRLNVRRAQSKDQRLANLIKSKREGIERERLKRRLQRRKYWKKRRDRIVNEMKSKNLNLEDKHRIQSENYGNKDEIIYIDHDEPTKEIKLKTEDDKRPLKCELCRYTCKIPGTLRKHMSKDHPESCRSNILYACTSCSYVNTFKEDIKKHIENKHGSKGTYTCVVGRPQSYNLEYDFFQVEIPYPCRFCNYVTTMGYDMTDHMWYRHRELIENLSDFRRDKHHTKYRSVSSSYYMCQCCDFKTRNPQRFDIHVSTSHAKRTYRCKYCSYTTLRKCEMNKHKASIHETDSLHVCNLCSFRTTRKSHLSRHILLRHTKEYVFSCRYCSYKTTSTQSFSHHVQMEHT